MHGERCCNEETRGEQAPCLAQAQPLRSHHDAAPEHCRNFKHHMSHAAGQWHIYLVQPEGAIICANTASPREGGGTSAAISTLTSGRHLNPHRQTKNHQYAAHAAINRATNARRHLQVHALFRALEHGVQRLDAVVEHTMAARSRCCGLQLKLF